MFLLLFLLWIIFNGRVTLEIVLFGVGIAAAVCVFMRCFFKYSIKTEFRALLLFPDLVFYVLVLIWEIIKANAAAVPYTLGFKKQQGCMCHFKVKLKDAKLKTLLANSITLTPGTITVFLKDDEFTVHCLDISMADGLTDSSFIRLLTRMEKKLEKHGLVDEGGEVR